MSIKAGGLTSISPASRSSRGVKNRDSMRFLSTSAKYCGGKADDDSGGSCGGGGVGRDSADETSDSSPSDSSA
eukprot:691591-Pleurochrysis_carterae.AAC.1